MFSVQDNYFEEAFKLRNVLEEFKKERVGRRKPTILGLREHIFTGRYTHARLKLMKLYIMISFCLSNYVLAYSYFSPFSRYSVSSLAWFMSNQESSFVTIGQRILANPLRYFSSLLAYIPFTCLTHIFDLIGAGSVSIMAIQTYLTESFT